MGASSNISWTDSTWNPVTGCSRVSPGCEHCYAESLSLRMGWSQKPWTAINAPANVVLHTDRLHLPLRWQQPRRIFVNSMSDLFHEEIPDDFIDRVFATMAMSPRHTFQLLTKRSKRMRDYLGAPGLQERWALYARRAPRMSVTFPLPNVWVGVSVEDQRRAEERIPDLISTPAALLFISAEPLLGPVDLREWLPYYTACGASKDPETVAALDELFRAVVRRMGGGIQWVIDGGESGSGFRAADADWFRSIRDQCVAAQVPYFHKQASAFKASQDVEMDGVIWHQFPASESEA